jgi:hypothetical protein
MLENTFKIPFLLKKNYSDPRGSLETYLNKKRVKELRFLL